MPALTVALVSADSAIVAVALVTVTVMSAAPTALRVLVTVFEEVAEMSTAPPAVTDPLSVASTPARWTASAWNTPALIAPPEIARPVAETRLPDPEAAIVTAPELVSGWATSTRATMRAAAVTVAVTMTPEPAATAMETTSAEAIARLVPEAETVTEPEAGTALRRVALVPPLTVAVGSRALTPTSPTMTAVGTVATAVFAETALTTRAPPADTRDVAVVEARVVRDTSAVAKTMPPEAPALTATLWEATVAVFVPVAAMRAPPPRVAVPAKSALVVPEILAVAPAPMRAALEPAVTE